MHILEQPNNTDSNTKWLQEFKQHPSAFTAVSLISLNNDIDQCFSIYNTLKSRSRPNSAVFTALVNSCIQSNEFNRAVSLWKDMCTYSVLPDKSCFTKLLLACAKTKNHSVAKGLFSKVENLELQFLLQPIDCNHFIEAFGNIDDAMRVLHFMDQRKIQANSSTYLNLLNLCSTPSNLNRGNEIYSHIIKHKFDFKKDKQVSAALITMFSKCGKYSTASEIFNGLGTRGITVWNAMLSAAMHHNKYKLVIELFEQMKQQDGLQPNRSCYLSTFMACTSLKDLQLAKSYHSEFDRIVKSHRSRNIKSDMQYDMNINVTLVNMYSKCGSFEFAQKVFRAINDPTLEARTAMMIAYIRDGQGIKTLKTIAKLKKIGVELDEISWISLLNECTTAKDSSLGKEYHKLIIQNRVTLTLPLINALMHMYAACGCLSDVIKLFDEVQQRGMSPDTSTYSSLFDACGWTRDLNTGMKYHSLVKQSGTYNDLKIFASIISMYGKCGSLAQVVNTIDELQQLGLKPDTNVWASIFAACAELRALNTGMRYHNEFNNSAVKSDIAVIRALIQMYLACGEMEVACKLFEDGEGVGVKQDGSIWTDMIVAYGSHGMGVKAIQTFELMKQELAPDSSVFEALINACSTSGLVTEAMKYYKQMQEQYNIAPSEVHQLGLIEALTLAGELDKAEAMISKLQPTNTIAWKLVLSACIKKGDVKRAERLFEHICSITPPTDDSIHSLLAKVYNSVGMLDNANNIQQQAKSLGLMSINGNAQIEIGNQIHSFGGHLNDNNPDHHQIKEKLNDISTKLQTNIGIIEINTHELAAVAFGLLKTTPGCTLRIFSNFYMNEDSHTAIKQIALVLRDPNRFHRFEHGKCSCDEYFRRH
jgi:pentatricopeptide repeat protein